MKSRFLFVFLIICCAQILLSIEVLSQTYTTSGLSTDWNSAAAWVKTNPNANPNFGLTPNTPPLGAAINYPYGSPVNIIVNHQINYNGGNTSIGGGNYGSLIVNSGGSINFNGDLNVNNSGGNAFKFQINDGGIFTVGGTLGIRSGATFNVVNSSNLYPKTSVQVNNLTFLNAGSGQSVNVGLNTIFKVVNQTRLEGGGVLNIQGEFNTKTFNSANSGGSAVNVSGNGTIRTTGDMQIQGFPMILSGNAGVVVGGNLNITNSGNSSLNLNGPNTNFTVINSGSTIASGKTPSGSCFQTPENGMTCFNRACLEELIISTSNNQFERIYIFRCSMNWTVPSDSLNTTNGDSLEIIDSFRSLTVAGGGGGGRGASAGGGGGGGIFYVEDLPLKSGTQINITVGKGGLGSASTSSRGHNGQNSQIQGQISAIGGGGGASTGSGVINGQNGGSGGGGASDGTNTGNGGVALSLLGNNGGNGSDNGNNSKGGGGGGAGAEGETVQPGNRPGGTGGVGLSYNISGFNTYYSGGGGAIGRRGGGNGGSGIGGTGDGSGSLRDGLTYSGSGGGATSSGAGGNGGSGIVIIKSVILRILPVEFFDFNATYQKADHSGLLNWSTAKEWENSHFEIERAVNSVKTWETIGRIEGAGYSERPIEYSFTDLDLPISGGNIFYRLKQVDFSGKYSYSSTRAIKIDAIESNQNWLAYPNPSFRGTEVRVELLKPEIYQDQRIYITLSNLFGQTKSFSPYSPEEISSIVTGWLDSSAPGLYILDIAWGNQRQQLKLIRN